MSIRDKKKQHIIDSAKDLFLAKGIEEVTNKEIAQKADVATVTVYRYFAKKINIVIAVAAKMSEEGFEGRFTLCGRNGLEKLKDFYTAFFRVYEVRPRLYRFLSEVDSYLAAENRDRDDDEKKIFPFYEYFSEAYEEGRRDGSVRELKKPEQFYVSTTHVLLDLCKKMAVKRRISVRDEMGEEEIVALIAMIVSRLQACNNDDQKPKSPV